MAHRQKDLNRESSWSKFFSKWSKRRRKKDADRELAWSKFFDRWSKRSAKSVNEDIPYKYLTGQTATLDKRKLRPVRGSQLFKKSKYGGINKYKEVQRKVPRRKCPNVATNDVNTVGEKSLQQVQELGSKDGDSLSIADDPESIKFHKESTVDINEELNTTVFDRSPHVIQSQQNHQDDHVSSKCQKESPVDASGKPNTAIFTWSHLHDTQSQQNHQEGYKYEEDELSPIFKKRRLLAQCIRKFEIDTADQNVDTPVKRKKEPSKGRRKRMMVTSETVCKLENEDTASFSKPRKCMVDELATVNCSLKKDVAVSVSVPEASNLPKPQDHKNGCEDNLLASVQGEIMLNELDRQKYSLRSDVTSDSSHSEASRTANFQDHRNGFEEKVLPSVPKEYMHNGLDGPNSRVKTNVATNKSDSKSCKLSKPHGHRNGSTDKVLHSVPGECIHNGLDGPNSSLKTDTVTNSSHSQHSKLLMSRDYTYYRKRIEKKPWPYIIVESDTDEDE